MVEEVLWTNEVNVSASNQGFTKIGSSGWNGGAFSRNLVYDRGYVQTIVNESNSSRMIGLNATDVNSSYTDIDYAIYLVNNGTMSVYENGSNRGGFGNYSSGDTLRIQLIESTVNYIKNGQIFYTSAVVPTFPLHVDMSLNTNGSTLEQIFIGNQSDNTCLATISGFGGIGASYQWILNGSNVGTNSNTYVNNGLTAGDSIQCVFTPGVFGCDVGASSSNFIAIEEIDVTDNISFSIINDSLQTATCLYAEEEIAWESTSSLNVSGNNVTKIASNGWDGGAFSYSSVGEGGFVQTIVNETNSSRMFGLNASNAGVSYTDIDYAVYLINNGTMRVYENGSNRGTFGGYATGDTIRIQVIDNEVKYLKNGLEFYASVVTPTLPLHVDLSINQIGGTLENIIVKNGVYGNFRALVTGAGANPSYQWKLNAGNVGSNSDTYTNTSLSDGDVVSCEITADYINCSNTIVASNNIVIDEISVTDNISFSITNDSLQAGTCLYADEEVAWQAVSSLSVSGNNVTKVGGGGWDGAAFSFSRIDEGGYAQTIVNEVNTSRMFGLNASNTSSSYNDIDYAIYLISNGNMSIYENGSNRGSFGGYSSGDTLRVQVIDNAVRYIKNGQTFYTSSVTPSLPLSVDLSINTLGGTLEDIIVSTGAYGRFKANASGAGANPTYQWKLNGGNVGSNSDTYTNTSLVDGDVVSCVLTADYINCTGSTVMSNEITANEISVADNISFSITSDSLQTGTCLYAEEEIAWELTTNLELIGNDVTKIGSSGWDGAAFSYSRVGEGGYVQTIINETNTSRMFGLNASNVNSSYTDIDFAVYLVSNGNMNVYENGSNRGTYGTYDTGDTIRVQVLDNEVRYIKNSQTFYTSNITPSLPLKVDLSINTLGGTLESILVSTGVYGLFKANATGAGVSPSFQWKLNGANVGSNSDSYLNTSLNDGDEVQCVITPDYINCSASTVTSNSITIDQIAIADNISFSITNDSLLTGACLIAEEEVSWEISSSLELNGNNVTKIGSSGWDGGAFSNSLVGEGGYAQTIVNEVNTNRMFGLNAVNANSSYTDIDYAVYLISNGTLRVYENGSNRGTFGSYSNGDTIKVLVNDNQVLYLKNSQVFYTSAIAPTLPLHVDLSINTLGATLQEIVASAGSYGRFRAIATGAGNNPTYQWKLNGGNVGSNSSIYTNTGLSAGDVITCELIADYINCSGNLFNSNEISLKDSEFSHAVSISSGNWSNASIWSCGEVPNAKTDVSINSAHTVTLTSDAEADDVSIEGSLVFSGNQQLTLDGNLENSGTIVPNLGSFVFEGNDAQEVSTTSDLDVNNLVLNNSEGLSLVLGDVFLSGTLTLTAGTFNTNNAFTIVSDISGTGRIAEIPAVGVSISGDVTVQRYIAAGATNWRFLTSAVSGSTLAQWNDDFITSGFTGSDYPSFGFVNIQSYDETSLGNKDVGFIPASNVTDPMSTGKGFFVWCGDTITGTQAFTIDVTGPANTGDISIPITYTDDATQAATEDGWNLIGNPYPSSIDWDDVSWTKTNINDAIYIWDANANQFATYIGGVGTNGGTNIIPSSQAFWVQSNASSPVLTAREGVKSPVDQNFLRKGDSRSNLSIKFSGNSASDEMVLSFHQKASDQFDQSLDASKIYSTAAVPGICTELEGRKYSINTINKPEKDLSVPIISNVPILGNYILTFDNELDKELYSCIYLEDTEVDSMINLLTDTSYMVNITKLVDSARFIIHLGANWKKEVEDVSCHGEKDGIVEIQPNGDGPWTYTLRDFKGTDIDFVSKSSRSYINRNLLAGQYNLHVNEAGHCGPGMQEFVIEQPLKIYSVFEVSERSEFEIGEEIRFINRSSNSTTYLWDFGDGNQSVLTEPYHTYRDSGLFIVTLESINDDCSETSSKELRIKGEKEDHTAEQESIKIYAHGDNIYVSFNSAESANTSIEVSDAIGRVVYKRELGNVKSLNEEIQLNATQSVFFVKVLRNEDVEIRKVVLSNY